MVDRNPFSRRARIGWMILAMALSHGCASTSSPPDHSPVEGWRFQIAVKFPSQQRYELFRITPTGEIQYGGGMSAMNDTTTWETALTPEQAAEFVELVHSLPWIQQVPKEGGDSKTEPVIVVKYQQHGGSERNFAIRGNTPESDKVIAFMKGLAQRRFQSALQKLPEPTEKPASPTKSSPQAQPPQANPSQVMPPQAHPQPPTQPPPESQTNAAPNPKTRD